MLFIFEFDQETHKSFNSLTLLKSIDWYLHIPGLFIAKLGARFLVDYISHRGCLCHKEEKEKKYLPQQNIPMIKKDATVLFSYFTVLGSLIWVQLSLLRSGKANNVQ